MRLPAAFFGVSLWLAPVCGTAADVPGAGPPTEVVIEAFRAVRDGWSSDEVLLDDDLNAAFIRYCRQRLPRPPG